MRIKLNGREAAYELRALSAMLLVLANHRGEDRYSVKFDYEPKSDPVPLAPGDAPTQFDVTDTMTLRPIAPDERVEQLGQLLAAVSDRHDQIITDTMAAVPVDLPKPKRTRASRAVAQLSLVPTVPSAAAEATPEVPPAPLVPSLPDSPPVAATPTVPETAAHALPTVPAVATPATTALSVPTAPSAPTADGPKTFPELMRALSSALASKRLTGDALNAACERAGREACAEYEAKHGIKAPAHIAIINLQGLLQHQALVPAVYAAVLASLGGAL